MIVELSLPEYTDTSIRMAPMEVGPLFKTDRPSFTQQDIHKSPIVLNSRLQTRMDVLQRTPQLGRALCPHYQSIYSAR